jgi:hypothetical protein
MRLVSYNFKTPLRGVIHMQLFYLYSCRKIYIARRLMYVLFERVYGYKSFVVRPIIHLFASICTSLAHMWLINVFGTIVPLNLPKMLTRVAIMLLFVKCLELLG